MELFCRTLLTMTMTASVAAAGVMLLRLPLKKAPRWITCALWLVVAVRMLCPVSFSLPVSLMPQTVSDGVVAQQVLPVSPATPAVSETPPAADTEPKVSVTPQTPTTPQWPTVIFAIWAAGAAGTVLWAAVSYARLRRNIRDAVLFTSNVYETDQIDTPFVCGFLTPRIYLPVGMDPVDRRYVLLHEQAHIKRRDHLTKPLAYLTLCIHWFNPVLWAAYRLFCRDVETACDQSVTRSFGRADIAGYAAALLHLGRTPSLPNSVPLAFGEEDAKGRIKGILTHKRPGFWVALLTVVAVILAAILLLSNPGNQGSRLDGVPITQGYVLDSGFRTDLPGPLYQDLIPMLQPHGKTAYTALPSYTPTMGTVVLTNSRREITFYLEPGPSPTLIREENGTFSASTQGGSIDTDAYSRWQTDLDRYLSEERADQILAMQTPYIGNHVACGNLLGALHVSEVAGPYTIQLQTTTAPYGITVMLKNSPLFLTEEEPLTTYCSIVSRLFLSLVDNAGQFTWVFADGSQQSISADAGKPLSQAQFRQEYAALREAAAACYAAATQTTNLPAQVRHLDPDTFPDVTDPPSLLLSKTAAATVTLRPDRFSVRFDDLNGAPEVIIQNPVYQAESLSQLPNSARFLDASPSQQVFAVSSGGSQETTWYLYTLKNQDLCLIRLDRGSGHPEDGTLACLLVLPSVPFSLRLT